MDVALNRTGRLRAFRSEDAATRAGMWARAAFFGDAKAAAWCRDKGIAIARAASEGVNTAGGFLVPEEMKSTIIALRDWYGAFRSSADIAPMGSATLDWPRRTGGVTAYFPGEGGAITESQAALGNVNLTAKKIAALTRTSSELDEDSVADLGDFLAAEIAYAFAVKEDLCGFLGDGSSPYGGIVGIAPTLLDGNHAAGKVAAASGHDTFAEIDAADLAAVIAALPAYAQPGARWFVSAFGYATTFCRLAAAAGGIVVLPDSDGRRRPHFLGFPVVPTQALPAVGTTLAGSVMLLFGDLRLSSVLGDRRSVTIARSESRYLDQDQIGFRGTERIDIVNHGLGDGTTAGAVVGLVGTA